MLFLPQELFHERKNIAPHQLPPTLFSLECFLIYRVLPFTIDVEYKDIVLHMPNYDFKHIHVPLSDFDELCMCV